MGQALRYTIEDEHMTMELVNDSVVVAKKDQVSANLSEDAVILDLSSGVYYQLNEIGAYIWKLIQEPRTIDVLVASLLEQYEVEKKRCEADLLELLGDMAEHGLIDISDAAHH